MRVPSVQAAGATPVATLAAARHRLIPGIEAALRAFMDRRAPYQSTSRTAAPASHRLTPNAPGHYGMMRYHLGWVDEHLAPGDAPTGKRLRPLICLLAAEACGGAADQVMPAAVSLELLHNFTLIHDDIEDGDAFRHHRPTLWKVWGEPQAINAGDGMHVLAHLALLDLNEVGIPAATVTAQAQRLGQTSLIITEGQHLDLSFERRHNVTPGEYLDMIARKSAALLSCAAAMGGDVAITVRTRPIGGTTAGSSSDPVDALASFGFDLGMGFQIQDDILGLWGRAETTGKPAGDLHHRKKTLPSLYALSRSEGAAREAIQHVFDDPAPTDAAVERALSVLDATGARRHCEGMVARYSESARTHLRALPNSEARDALEALAVQLEKREV